MKDSIELAKGISKALESKKAENIKIIDITSLSDIADYFILATANNPNQMDALQDAVEEYMIRENIPVKNIEGQIKDKSNWILMDYTDIVVHIFDREAREFYDLEHIWKGGPVIEL